MNRVMIVDDEPGIRHGLSTIIKWNKLDCMVVGVAEDGVDAVEKIPTFQPDIIISDIKMPGMDGIALAKAISEKYPRMKVILLTGYAEFSYAQSAIKYGVIDFVLKPSTNEDIEKAVIKAVKALADENNRSNRIKTLEEKTHQNIVLIQEKFLNDVVNNFIVDNDIIQQGFHELSIHLNNYYVVVYEIEDINHFAGQSNRLEQNKFILSMKNFLALAFKNFTGYHFFINNTRACSIVCFDIGDRATCLQVLLTKCEEILSIVGNFMDFSVLIGISAMHSNSEGITEGFEEARKAIMNRFFDDISICFYSDSPTSSMQNNSSWISKSIDNIMQSIQSGNETSSLKQLSELLERLKSERRAIEEIINTGILLCSLCSKLLGNYNSSLSNLKEGYVNIYKIISDCTSLEQLGRILDSVTRLTIEYLSAAEKQSSYIIKKALEYISNNYVRNISLQSIADYIHVNSSYLSRVYKKETGDTLTEAITRYRVEKSKQLLTSTDYKTYEIALMSGFEDSSYFSIVFKKYTGLSPKEYRSRWIQI